MIEGKVTVVGTLNLNKHLDNMSKMSLYNGISRAIDVVQEEAKGKIKNYTGELQKSILTDVEQHGDLVIGSCFTSKPQAFYKEFGTGPKGQAKHDDISPDVAVAYKQVPWWIPEGKGWKAIDEDKATIDKEVADHYHMPRRVLYSDGDPNHEVALRYTEGQPARPFMYPALKNNEKNIIDIVKEEVRKEL